MYIPAIDRRAVEISDIFYEKLVYLMKTERFEKIKIAVLCKECNVGRATFYRHYDVLEDILRERCDMTCMNCIPFFQEYYMEHSLSEPILLGFLRYWEQHSAILEQIISSGKNHLIADSFDWMFENLREVYFENKDLTRYRNYFVAIRRAMLVAILTEWVKDEKKLKVETLFHIINSQAPELLSFENLTAKSFRL